MSLLYGGTGQEDQEFKASLDYLVRPCLKTKQANEFGLRNNRCKNTGIFYQLFITKLMYVYVIQKDMRNVSIRSLLNVNTQAI